MEPCALTVIQGAPGAGKTTLLNAMVARSDRRHVKRVEVCRAAELGPELARLAAAPVDHVLVELGVSLGSDVAAYASGGFGAGSGAPSGSFEPARVITVIDATRFLVDLTHDTRVESDALEGRGQLAMLLAEQAEAAAVLVVTKADLVSADALRVVLAVVGELNPAATVAVARHGLVRDVDLLEGERLELARENRPKPPTDVLDPAAGARAAVGVSSYVYRGRSPFHPARLRAHLLQGWSGVIRSRGSFWLATRMNEVGAWSAAGPVWQISRSGFWWSALEEQGWPIPASIECAVRAQWREPFGDRRQELTLIGLDLDTRSLEAAFDACLLTPEELEAGPSTWAELEDPFPDWNPSVEDRLGADS